MTRSEANFSSSRDTGVAVVSVNDPEATWPIRCYSAESYGQDAGELTVGEARALANDLLDAAAWVEARRV